MCFNAIPDRVTFLAGVLDSEIKAKERKAPQRRQRNVEDNVKEVQPEQVEHAKKDVDQLSAAEKTMHDMKKRLKKRGKEEYLKNVERAKANNEDLSKVQETGSEIDGIQFLFNPKSFTQTVENIFQFSFMIKKGEAEIGIRSKMDSNASSSSPGLPCGLYVKARKGDEQSAPETTQSVLSFTMRDWKMLCEAHGLENGDMPHRTGSKHQPHHKKSPVS